MSKKLLGLIAAAGVGGFWYYNTQKNKTPIVASKNTTVPATTAPAKSWHMIISGGPACGKGTQCDKLKAKYGVVHISTGDLLREHVSKKSELGVKAKTFMDTGKLVPDELVIDMTKERLDRDDCKKTGWLLDGFPRTQAQAKALDAAGAKCDAFISVEVPDETMIGRAVTRRLDPKTGNIYNTKSHMPTDPEVVKRLITRSDDTEEKMKERLAQFHKNVDAVIGSYKPVLVSVNGNQHPDKVFEEICKGLENLSKPKVTFTATNTTATEKKKEVKH
eukprot:TRINITY_DN175_c0_g1_i1.p1 TRINITY_DN175_c0_g1~~TRINITY_DN175_c0_g1_i1.p1  ORF type:complete len:291 (+),score=84.82 TRINITY_DN175_c0_g1_i1:46-873(+)